MVIKKNKIYWLVAGSVLALLIFNKWQPWKGKVETRPTSAARGAALSVRGLLIKPASIESRFNSTGTVLAYEMVDLQSEISGRVTQINFKEGNRVRKGDVLVQINDADLQAQQVRAKWQLQLAEEVEARKRKQLDIEAVSQEEYEAALNKLNTTRADLQLIEAQIEKSRIAAPFDGAIGLRYISLGGYVSPTSRIARLVDDDPVKIEFSIPERYTPYIRNGQAVSFRLQNRPEIQRGTIYAMEPQIETDTRSLRVRALAPNPDGKIFPGSFADVTLDLQQIDQTIMIPSEALLPEMQQQRVYVAKNGRAAQVTVETGLRTNEEVQITSGLQVGDTLITSGLLQLRPGIPVRFREIN